MLDNKHIIIHTRYQHLPRYKLYFSPIRVRTRLVPFYITKVPIFSKELPHNKRIDMLQPSNLIEAIIYAPGIVEGSLSILESGLKRNLLNTYTSGLINNLSISKNYNYNATPYYVKSDLPLMTGEYVTYNDKYLPEYPESDLNEQLLLWTILTLLLARDLVNKIGDKCKIENIIRYSFYKSVMLLPFIYNIVQTKPIALPQWNFEYYDNIILFSFLFDSEIYDNVKNKMSHSGRLDLKLNPNKYNSSNQESEYLFTEPFFAKSQGISLFQNYPFVNLIRHTQYFNLLFEYVTNKMGNLVELHNKEKYLIQNSLVEFKKILNTFKNSFVNRFSFRDYDANINKKIALFNSLNKLNMMSFQGKFNDLLSKTKFNFSKPISLLFQNSAIKDNTLKIEDTKNVFSKCLKILVLYFSTVLWGHEVRFNPLKQWFFAGQQFFIKDSLFSQALLSLFMVTSNPKIKFGWGQKFLIKLRRVFAFDVIFENVDMKSIETHPFIAAVKDYNYIMTQERNLIYKHFSPVLSYIQ